MSYSTPPVPSSSVPTPAPLRASQPPPAQPQPAQTSLPSPAVFDILPPLHELLSRLLADDAEATAAAHFAHPDNGPAYQNQQPLSMQHLAGEVSTIRNRIRKARTVVENLPDIERTIQEQEEEIRLLRLRIAKQTATLSGMSRDG